MLRPQGDANDTGVQRFLALRRMRAASPALQGLLASQGTHRREKSRIYSNRNQHGHHPSKKNVFQWDRLVLGAYCHIHGYLVYSCTRTRPMLLGLALLYCRPLRRGVSLISSNPCTLEQQPPERDPKGSMAFLQNKVQCPPMLGA
jgi:hypothetical protein